MDYLLIEKPLLCGSSGISSDVTLSRKKESPPKQPSYSALNLFTCSAISSASSK